MHRRGDLSRLWRLTIIGITTLSVVAGVMVSGMAPASADACSTSAGGWNPVLRDTTVNQGLGSDVPLVRGKRTVVRLFLTAPACAPLNSVQLTGATLTVNGTVSKTYNPTPAVGTTYPTFDAANTPAQDSKASPIFIVNTADVSNAATPPTSFSLTFGATINYRYQAVTGVWTSATTVIAATSLPTVQVAPATNPLRLLVVPMGDKSQCTSFPASCSQYPDVAQQQMLNGLSTLSRLLPVADAVGPITTLGGAGLQYALAPTMLDLGPAGLNFMNSASPKFCGSSDTFINPARAAGDLDSQLSAALRAYNSANPVGADRVVGVVWQGISDGAGANRNPPCNEGLAAVNSKEAWVRLLPDVTNADPTKAFSSMSGAIMGMEVSHTWGSIPSTDPRSINAGISPAKNGTHSKNSQADLTSPGRGYNTSMAAWLQAPVSDMRYQGDSTLYSGTATTKNPWTNDTALLEQGDYAFDQCVFTPPPPGTTPSCGAAAGTVGVSAAGGSVVISGETDGTPGGTSLHTYVTASNHDNTTANGQYRVVQRTGVTGPVVQDDGIPSTATTSHTDSNGGTTTATSNVVTIDVAFTQATGANVFEVWNGEPPAGATTCVAPQCLYSRQAGGNPQIESETTAPTTTDAVDYTAAAGTEQSPALSPDGKFVAWSVPAAGATPDSVVVRAVDATTHQPVGAASAPLAGAEPAWTHDGRVAIVRGGNIYLETFNAPATPGAAPTFSNETLFYDRTLQSLASTAASHPSVSFDDKSLVAAVNGHIWLMDLTQPSNAIVCSIGNFGLAVPCRPLTTSGATDAGTGTNANPAFSPGSLVAYEHGPDVWTLDVAQPLPPYNRTERVLGASSPAWGSTFLAFAQAGNIAAVDSQTFLPAGQITTGGQDGEPSITDDNSAIAFTRDTGGATGTDVFVGGLSQRTITFRVTGNKGADLRADLYLTCGTANLPIAFALKPVATSDTSADFSYTYNPVQACNNGVIKARATNGYDVTPLRTMGTIRTPLAPSAAIYTPAPDASILQYDAIVGTGGSFGGSAGPNGLAMTWTLTGPSGSGFSNTTVGTAATFVQDPPLPGGFKPGAYTLTLTVSDSVNPPASVSRSFTITADANNDGVGPVACISDTGAPQGSGDADKDGIANSDDPFPCTSSVNVTAQFNPQTLYVPSTGNDVTVYLSSSSFNLAGVNPSTVMITQVGPWRTAFPATSWSICAGTVTVKFDRQALNNFLASKGLVRGVYVPIVVTGATSTATFRALDPKYPTVTPA